VNFLLTVIAASNNAKIKVNVSKLQTNFHVNAHLDSLEVLAKYHLLTFVKILILAKMEVSVFSYLSKTLISNILPYLIMIHQNFYFNLKK